MPRALDNKSATTLYADDVNSIMERHQRAVDYHHRKLDRNIQNWRFYWGIDAELGLGQWPEPVVQDFIQQNRRLCTYNFVKVIIDNLAGSLAKVPFEPDFLPVNSKVTSLTEAIKKAMYSDKEIMDWPTSYLELIINGLIMEGVLHMVISNEYDDLGNIGFEVALPGTVVADPNWKKWSSKSCRRCWKESWYTASELVDLHPQLGEFLNPYVLDERRNGTEYGPNTGILPYGDFAYKQNIWGSAHKVIEEYEMVKERYMAEFVVTPNGEVEIPRKLKNPDEKIDWLFKNVPDWSPEYVYQKEKTTDIQWLRTSCPTLIPDGLIVNAPTEVQIGRLEWFWWSASRANGECHSIVDSIKDAQLDINYWNSLLINKIQSEGGGGAQFVDRNKFANEEEYRKFLTQRNNPRANFEVKDIDDGTPAQPVQTNSGFPQEVYQHLNTIIQVILPNISKSTPASMGRTETVDPSGALYNQLRAQSEQQIYTLHYGLRIFWNEVYEAYLMQAADTYSQEGVQRKFPFKGGKDEIILNEKVTLPDGSKAIRNDVGTLKSIRHKVIISEKQDTPTQKMDNIRTMNEYLKIVSQVPTKVATINYAMQTITENIDQFSEEDKEALAHLGAKELELAEVQIEVQTLQGKAQAMQLSAQIKQAESAEAAGQQHEQQGGEAVPGQEAVPAEPGKAEDQISLAEGPPQGEEQQQSPVIPQGLAG